MAFSVTCSICGRQFVGIDNSLIGQQARCNCGATVELDPVWDEPSAKVVESHPIKQRSENGSTQKRSAKREQSRQRGSSKTPHGNRAKTKSAQARNKSSKQLQAKKVDPDSGRSTTGTRQKNSRASGTTKSAETNLKDGNGKQSAVPAGHVEEPPLATFDNFDIDDILSKGADNSPVMPTRHTESPTTENELGPTLAGVVERTPSRMGIGGSIVGGVSGLTAAGLLLLSRFTNFSGTPLGWIGQAFYGAYSGSLGSGEMSERSISLFTGAGVGLLILALLIGVASMFLVGRVIVRIATQRKLFGWSRAMLATLSVICLFALMGLLFIQSIHHGEQLQGLLDFAGAPLEGLIPENDNDAPFKEVREQYEAENREFMVGIASFAVLPLLAFGGSIASLFFDEK